MSKVKTLPTVAYVFTVLAGFFGFNLLLMTFNIVKVIDYIFGNILLLIVCYLTYLTVEVQNLKRGGIK